MHNLFIDSISSNLLHSKDEVVVFRLVSIDGMLLFIPFYIQHKARLEPANSYFDRVFKDSFQGHVAWMKQTRARSLVVMSHYSLLIRG